LRGLLLEDFQGKVGKETLQHMRQSHTVKYLSWYPCISGTSHSILHIFVILNLRW
jgi:hypothetical protein